MCDIFRGIWVVSCRGKHYLQAVGYYVSEGIMVGVSRRQYWEEWVEAKVSLSSSTDLAMVLAVSVSEAIVLFHLDVCKGIREVE